MGALASLLAALALAVVGTVVNPGDAGAEAAGASEAATSAAMRQAAPTVTGAVATGVSDPFGQKITVSNFKRIRDDVGYDAKQVSTVHWPKLFPWVNDYYTPSAPSDDQWVHVSGSTPNNGNDKWTTAPPMSDFGGLLIYVPWQLQNRYNQTDMFSFQVNFPTPVANPRLDLSIQSASWYICNIFKTRCDGIRAQTGTTLKFSGAKGASGDAVPVSSLKRISGIDQVPYSNHYIDGTSIRTDGGPCWGYGTLIDQHTGIGCVNNDDFSFISRMTFGFNPWDPSEMPKNGYDPAGTIEVDTGGVPVSSVTITESDRFILPTEDEWTGATFPVISLAYAGSGTPIATDNLKVTKSVIAGQQAYRGQSVTYRVTVATTDGQPTSADATMTDSLPSQLEAAAITAAPSIGTATAYGSTVVWTIPKGTASGSSLEVTARVKADASIGTMTNTALLSGQCKGENCMAQASSEILPDVARNNLKVTKTVTQGASAHRGDLVAYRVAVSTTDGQPTASAQTMTDVLPAQLEEAAIAAAPGIGTARIQGGTLTWSIPAGTVPDTSLTVTGRVRQDAATGPFDNTATLSGLCDGANCASTATATVLSDLPNNNLAITKSVVSGASARAGEFVTYRLALSNVDGRPTQSPTSVTDTIPAQLTGAVISLSPTVGTASISGGKLTWAIPAGSTGNSSLQIRAQVRTDASPGTLTNTATLSGLCEGSSCTSTVTSVIDGQPADLTVTKTGPATVKAGQSITYRITLANNGGSATADPVTVTDVLPAGITNATVNATQGTASISGGQVTWQLPAGIAPNDSRVFTATVTGTVASSVTAGTVLRNTATISAGPCTGSGCSSQVVTTVAKPDTKIVVTKTNSLGRGARVKPGQPYSYTFEVRNDGTDAATGLQLTDTLTPYLTFPAGTQTDWTIAGKTATSSTFTLPAGGYRSFTLNVVVANDAPGETVLRNTAVIPSLVTPDECSSDSSLTGCAADPFPPMVDDAAISVTKSNDVPGDPKLVRRGAEFNYTLVVRNAGASPATGVRVRDLLPAGLEFYPADQPGWALAGNTALSDPLNLAGKGQTTLTLHVRVTADATGTLRNASAIDGTTPPATCLTNVAATGCGVDPNPPSVIDHSKVTITKANNVQTAGKTVRVGDSFIYTITLDNAAATPATDVLISDKLPTGLEFDGPQASDWKIDTATQTATATVTVPARSSRSYDLRVKVVEGASGTLRNVAVMDERTPAECAVATPPAGCGVDPEPPHVVAPLITLAKSNDLAGANRVVIGQRFTYTITATNNGNVAAQGVVLRDVLPEGLSFAPTSQTDWTINGQDAVSVAFNLAVGASRSFKLSVEVDDSVADGVTLTNVVVQQPGPTPAACLAAPKQPGCATDTAPPTADATPLGVVKYSNAPYDKAIDVGTPVLYTIVVTNRTAKDAANVVLADKLPAALTPDPTVQEGWTFRNGVATSAPFLLPAHSSVTLKMSTRAIAPSAEKQRNVVAVTAYELVSTKRVAAVMKSKVLESSDTSVADCLVNPTADLCSYADVAVQPATGATATEQPTTEQPTTAQPPSLAAPEPAAQPSGPQQPASAPSGANEPGGAAVPTATASSAVPGQSATVAPTDAGTAGAAQPSAEGGVAAPSQQAGLIQRLVNALARLFMGR